MLNTLRIATRKSPLALWQAEHVQSRLEDLYPKLSVELVPMTTEGDRILDTPLAEVGGKGLFIKELEHALLSNKADIAVHSMKDVTIDLPDELDLPVILEREKSHDAFVSNTYKKIQELPEGAIVGTSSMRRQAQLRAFRPDLEIKTLRGNVGTRLSKLDNGDYDAIILAAAGLKRLELEKRIQQLIPHEILLPAVGQAAVGIECRAGDDKTIEIINALKHEITQQAVLAERAFSRRLFGGCTLPIAAFATIDTEQVNIQGLVASVDGKQVVAANHSGTTNELEAVGTVLAEMLLEQGADKILAELKH